MAMVSERDDGGSAQDGSKWGGRKLLNSRYI